jgi:hypothetical protein
MEFNLSVPLTGVDGISKLTLPTQSPNCRRWFHSNSALVL